MLTKWVEAGQTDFDCMFQVTSDFIGITNAIHIMDNTNDDDGDDADSDTNTIVDDDKTECD